MIKVIRFIQKYSTQLKYGLLFAVIFLMIFAIRSYLNNIAILDAIDGVENEKLAKTDEINFTQNFLIKYLGSDYADYFLAHENSILYKNEYILRLDMNIQQKDLTGNINTGNQITGKNMNSQQSWKDFLGKKLKEVK
ncbi:MAG: hypothetical protein WAZ12_04195 [Candidatus Absconditicoccaceae bacterium]